MPLTNKGEKIKRAMEKEYGKENGERVFYASANKGTITGVHDASDSVHSYHDAVRRGDAQGQQDSIRGMTRHHRRLIGDHT
jgi:hypothetical protein